MAAKKYEKKYSCAHWIRKNDGTYRWEITTTTEKFDLVLKSWVNDSVIVEEKTPSEIGLVKSFEINVLFCKEVPNNEEFNQVSKVWFHQKMHYQLRSDMGDNLWFKYDEGKLFLKSIDPNYAVCLEVSLEGSNSNYVVKKSHPVKVTPQQALEIQKSSKTKYVYSKVETSGSEITYITTC